MYKFKKYVKYVDRIINQRDLIIELASKRISEIIDNNGKDYSFEFSQMNDIELFGMPEGSIVTLVRRYYTLKMLGLKDNEIFINIVKEREKLGFPKSKIPEKITDSSFPLGEFIVYRLRIEEPELWTEDKLSDEFISNSTKEVYGIYMNCDTNL